MHQPWEIDVTIYHSEDELVTGLRHHDQMACACLLKHFAPRLLRFTRRLVGDDDEAEDVLQDSLIAACGRIDGFEGRSGLGTWLHRIVLNTALMRLRRKQPQLVAIDAMDVDAGPSPGHATGGWERPLTGVPPEDPIAVVLDHELQEVVERAVLALPVHLRTAFVLRDMEGLSTRATAEVLGITEAAVKVRLHRARLALREALTAYVHMPGDAVTAGAAVA